MAVAVRDAVQQLPHVALQGIFFLKKSFLKDRVGSREEGRVRK